MTLLGFGLIGLILLGLTKRLSSSSAMTPASIRVFVAPSIRSCSQCGAGLQEQMDALFPERRVSQTHTVTKKSDGNMPRKPALDEYPRSVHLAFGLVRAIADSFASWLWVR